MSMSIGRERPQSFVDRPAIARRAEVVAAEVELQLPQSFLWLPVAFGCGIGIYFLLPAEPQLMMVALGLAAAIAVRLSLGRHLFVVGLLMNLAIGILAGGMTASMRTAWVAAPVLPDAVRNASVSGWIELIEPRVDGGRRYTLLVTGIEPLPPGGVPARVRIRAPSAEALHRPGDHIRLTANLLPPAAPAYPGAYDFARQAWFAGLGAVGYARAPAAVVPAAHAMPWWLAIRSRIAVLRQAIGERITTALPGERGHIANALITGERGGITEETNTAFRDSGLLHILSISGLHMSIMAGSIFVALRFVLAMFPSLALHYPIRKWSAVGAAAGALAYLAISGGAVPTIRSYIMISIMFIAVLADRRALALRNVALAALLILAVWPESLLDVGFQMSFAAVAALIALYEPVEQRTRAGIRRGWYRLPLAFIAGIVVSTLVASLAVAPFAAYHFHKSQQYAVLANLIAIPVCNVLVMPAALATLIALPFGLENGPLQVMALGIDAMAWCARAVAALPGAVMRLPGIPFSAFIAMVGGGLWLLLVRGRLRWVGTAPIVASLVLASSAARPDVLVGDGGRLVAVRNASGSLDVAPGRGGSYQLTRWLEYDGDARTAEEARQAGMFQCDPTGCVHTAAGHAVALSVNPSALAADCQRAVVIIATFEATVACSRPNAILLDKARIDAAGSIALYFRGDTIALISDREERGRRPWVRSSERSRH